MNKPTLLILLLLTATTFAAPESGFPKPIAPLLQPFVDSHTLAGAVLLVADKDKILALEAVGSADIAANRPMQTGDLFWIASMSKPMTAAALLMLVDEGKLSLDDPVEKYLPEFKGQQLLASSDKEVTVLKKPTHPITIREILSHTSGQPFMSRAERKIDQFTLAEATLTYALTPLKFEPGTKYDYSNAGINTAGRIIEVVSGISYESFMQTRLLDPLGMKDTTFRPAGEQLARIAKSYRPDAAKTGLEEIKVDQLTYPLDNPKRGPSPAGGYFSTASDVALFGQMILNGGTFKGRKYLSPQSIRELTHTQTPGTDQAGYGLGFSTTRRTAFDPNNPVAGPCGHGGAYATNLSINPQKNLVLVYMVQHAGYANIDGGKIQPTFAKAAEEAFGK